MKPARRFLLCLALLPGLCAAARPPKAPEPKAAEPIKVDPQRVAVLSLLGDSVQLISLSATRPDAIQSGEWAASPPGSLDGAVLQSIDTTVKGGGLRKEVKLYTSTTRALFGDPATLFVDGRLALPGKLDDAVRQSGAAQLLLITRNRQAATLAGALPVLPGLLDSTLEGPGFVLDQRPTGQIGIDGSAGLPILAPYVFLRVALIDVTDLKVRREQSIAAARRLPVAREAGANPWAALTAAQRNAELVGLIEAELPKAVTSLLAR